MQRTRGSIPAQQLAVVSAVLLAVMIAVAGALLDADGGASATGSDREPTQPSASGVRETAVFALG